MRAAAQEFLGQERIAVAGVSRDPKQRVWLHRGLGRGSSSQEAVAACRQHGIAVIPGGCPNMFGATSDPGHRGMLRVLQVTGKVPRRLDAYSR